MDSSAGYNIKDEYEQEKCGEVFRTNGAFSYVCYICTVKLEEARDFEQHVLLHFNLTVGIFDHKTEDDPHEDEIPYISHLQIEPFTDMPVAEIDYLAEDTTVKHEENHLESTENEGIVKQNEVKICNKNRTVRRVRVKHYPNYDGDEDPKESLPVPSKKTRSDVVNAVCKICDKTYVRLPDFKRHMRFHESGRDVRKRLECDICKVTYWLRDSLIMHMRKHSGERPFACNVCPATFRTKDSWKTHEQNHTGAKPYGCNICDSRFTTPQSCKTHIRRHEGIKAHLCTICGQSFVQGNQLTRHTKERHTESHVRYKCSSCPKDFRTPKLLAAHKRMHTDQRLFDCTECSKSFKTGEVLKEHQKLHSGIKSYLCRYCGAAFAQRAGKRCHERRVHEET